MRCADNGCLTSHDWFGLAWQMGGAKGEAGSVAILPASALPGLQSLQTTSRDSSDLPAGWRFDPTDAECLGHLEGSMAGKAVHRDLKDVIVEIPGTDGLCRFDPWELPREPSPTAPPSCFFS